MWGSLSLAVAAALVPLRWSLPASPHRQGPGPLPAGYRVLRWAELMPPGWAPLDGRRQADLRRLRDDEPRARQWQQDLQQVFAQAPVVGALDGQAVRIQGYVVPLSVGWGGTDEFLLVPYHGACIHSPPPPPNQIIHVRSPVKVEGARTMSVVAITGRLRVRRSSSSLAAAHYQMNDAEVALLPAR